MVDEVTQGTQIAIHQAVHGYVEGHRELWGSLRLKPRDAKTVLVYSDIASSGLGIGEHGYLTGYPLPDSGYYALARTWPAPEMHRPGAVWTHTLFVEFADVASIRDATTLLPLFRRPVASSASQGDQAYGETVKLNAAEMSPFSFGNPDGQAWYRQVITCLYGFPESEIVALSSAENALSIERCVLALWSQQWPRLRRAFRFCTLTSADRSTDTIAFDLQVVPGTERGVRSRFPGAVLAHETRDTSAPWTDHLVTDLESPATSGLRGFLQQVGADITRGRGAVVPLARLHMILNSHGSDQSDWADAIDLLEGVSQGGASTVVQVVLSAAAKNVQELDRESLMYLLKHLDVVGRDEVERCAAQLGSAIWRVSPSMMAELNDQGEVGRLITDAGLSALPVEDLLDGLENAHRIAEVAFERRPELLEGDSLWRSSPDLMKKALQFAAKNPNVASTALVRLVGSGTTSVIPDAFAAFGSEKVWQHLVTAAADAQVEPKAVVPWLNAGSRYPDALAHVLASEKSLERPALVAIARMTDPDLVPNDYGDDPWAIALHAAHGHVSPADDLYFYCYLLARALGPRSRNIVALVEASFSAVYGAVATASLSPDSWLLVEPRLPSASYWQDWDRCQQIAVGVAQLYVRKELSAASFSRLGRSEGEFTSLVDAAAKEWGGRSYLRGVKRELKGSRRADFDRLHIVEEAVDSWF